ncbi:hypothetical protein POVWA1_060570 [Plasmodium ovale wallikeri]|uniref:Uncharacterized protein n=1 Tax=Plasmodium ovale wallikeri TaxID=864142 RepID=A0A1A9A1E4_PLAOA|nr:hypothetical protein POVWA1_060570 [Plasmodium ovale wallikeri]
MECATGKRTPCDTLDGEDKKKKKISAKVTRTRLERIKIKSLREDWKHKTKVCSPLYNCCRTVFPYFPL